MSPAPHGLRTNLLRPDRGTGEAKVTNVELFFDLVFVFAITQLSHLLIAHPGAPALVRTTILGVAVWTLWIHTAWVTNWLDPDRPAIGRGLVVTAGLVLVVAGAIPHAFDDRPWLFAVPVVAIQVGRSGLTAWAMRRPNPVNALNFVRIGTWFALGGVLWIAGAAADEHTRMWWWAGAAAVELAAPRLMFWVPGLGASSAQTWDVHPEHMAERVSLFIIIAIGESVVVTGSSFADLPVTTTSVAAFVAAFVSSVLAFLLFFHRSHDEAAQYFRRQEHPGMVAQTAYTYVPMVMVIGIVLMAVADELVLAHPHGDGGHTEAWTAGLLCGSVAVYLLGNALFRRATGGGWSQPHLLGVLLVLVLAPVSTHITPLALSWTTTVVMLLVLVADQRAAGRGRAPR